ncbi:MAG: cadmium-translocating P-type ATPase [Candidatus Delongbacteria bacterium]|nr:cadmium-translocating P-type ATPase [Candidatus Delongbacteria bacterium]MBN2834746.1 cadmium-translocating P-type ATPase [Candidatus Delongbacteria bacterium]
MNKSKYNFHGIDCPVCAGKIEREINKIKDIQANINFSAGTISINYRNFNETDLLNKINATMHQTEPGSGISKLLKLKMNNICNSSCCNTGHHEHDHSDHNNREHNHDEHNNDDTGFDKKTVLFFFTSLALLIFSLFIENDIISTSGFILSYIIGGYTVILKAFNNLKRGSLFDENFLMVIATFGAIYLKEFPEAVSVMLFYKAGEIFQHRAVQKSRNQIKSLTSLLPEKIRVISESGFVEKYPTEAVIGEIFEVRTGEKVPVDGVIIEGSTTMNTSSLNGESLEKLYTIEDEILGGFVNTGSNIKVRVNRDYKNTTVSRILNIIENAVDKKSATENYLTKFARLYTPIVVLLAVLIITIPVFFFNGLFDEWLYKGMMFLVISCPCALVLSVPLTYFASIGRSAKEGILIKGSGFLDDIAKAKIFAFDKTGTLTTGNMKINPLFDISTPLQLNIFYTMESGSIHPIAKVLTNFLKSNRVDIENLKELKGFGLEAEYQGNRYLAGSISLMKLKGVSLNEIPTGSVYFAENNKIVKVLELVDEIKKGSEETIDYINKNGCNTVLISGDNKIKAEDLAKRSNINLTFSQKLPDEKVEVVKNLKNNGIVVYTGDGINDAPVMTIADVGVSMGKLGSDAAIEASDVVIVNDDIKLIPKMIKLAKTNRTIIIQNIIFILLTKIIIMIAGVFGLSGLWQAVFADVGVALLAVLNSMRILWKKLVV